MATLATLSHIHRLVWLKFVRLHYYEFVKYKQKPRVTLEMKVLGLKKNSLNIQKCLLPDCEFLRRNFGRYCIILQGQCKLLVKVGLCEIKNVDEALFLDESVSLIPSLEKAEKTEHFSDVTFEDFVLLSKPRTPKSVQVVVVFSDFLDVRRRKNYNLMEVVRDILKLFIFCKSSLVSLSCLALNQTFGINSILIENIYGAKNNEIFRIDSSTEIKIEECISQLKFDQQQKKENLVEVGGCSRVYNILKETLEFAKCFKSNITLVNKLLLIGPPGCGKTTLIQNVAIDTKCILLEIQASHINTLTPVEMEKKLIDVFEEAKIYAEQMQCCVILIEDVDLMCSGRTLLAKRFVSQLIILLEDVNNTCGVVVVATTNCPDDVESQLRKPRRLEDELEIMIPTIDERMEILEKIFSLYRMKIEKKWLHQFSYWTPGFVGADLKLLVVEALMLYKNKGLTKGLDQHLLMKCFKQALTKVIPSALRGTVGLCTTKMTFSQIGGLEEIKKTLDLLVKQQLENPKKFQKFGIPLTKGILLYGPPGCAKTILVKALAEECNATFLTTSAADLYSPFVGDAEKKIVQLFTQARIGSPSILFIDEIDAVVGCKSGERERGVQERILSTLLIEMDGVGLKINTQRNNSLNILSNEKENKKEMNSNVVVIGATNRPQLIDDALKRPGRLDRLLYVPPPDAYNRLKILEKLTEKMPLHKSVDLNYLAKVTDFYSGADLKNFCQEAGLHALNSTSMAAEFIHLSHFEHVLNEYKPSLNEKIVNFYGSFQKYNI